MSVDFYRAFEDKFRGSRELIQSRLAVYLPFIHPLKAITESPKALDLGCGRGEWLELLRQEGIDATGVDLDEGMLKACQELQLNAVRAEAISYLKSLPDASVGVVSSFHMVEHISFEALQTLVQQALRVLIPGGLLIMETPNPENLQVGAHTFYYDPTHQRPIPPLLLAFLPEHYGYGRTAILRLQQEPRLDSATTPSLLDVLTGPSPDYAVVAQKSASPAHLAPFEGAFSYHYGLTLNTLAMRYDTSRAERLDATARDSQQALMSASIASKVAQEALAEARHTRDLTVNLETKLQHYQHLSNVADERIQALLTSTSWQITAPLRWVSSVLRRLLTLLSRVLRFVARMVLLPLMKAVLARPHLQQRLSSVLKRFPRLAHRLHLLAIHRGLVEAPDTPTPVPYATAVSTHQIPLTPHAQRIYDQLKKDIAHREGAKNS